MNYSELVPSYLGSRVTITNFAHHGKEAVLVGYGMWRERFSPLIVDGADQLMLGEPWYYVDLLLDDGTDIRFGVEDIEFMPKACPAYLELFI